LRILSLVMGWVNMIPFLSVMQPLMVLLKQGYFVAWGIRNYPQIYDNWKSKR
jgi:hypothetical protein